MNAIGACEPSRELSESTRECIGPGSRVEFFINADLRVDERHGVILNRSKLVAREFNVRWDDGFVSSAPPEWLKPTARPAPIPGKKRRGRPTEPRNA